MVDLRGSKWARRSSSASSLSRYYINNNTNTNTNTNNDINNNFYSERGSNSTELGDVTTANTKASQSLIGDRFGAETSISSSSSSQSTSQSISQSTSISTTKSIHDLVQRRNCMTKFTRLARRLKWKSRALLFSHHRALDADERVRTVVGGVAFPMDVDLNGNLNIDLNDNLNDNHNANDNVNDNVNGMYSGREAEMMFKVDFFEFYVLLERVLVLLLGVCGSVVVATGTGTGASGRDRGVNWSQGSLGSSRESRRGMDVNVDVNVNADDEEKDGRAGPKSLREQLVEEARQRSQQQQQQQKQRLQLQNTRRNPQGALGDSTMFHGYAHRFHANVLAALDQPGHPLHDCLGTGDVRTYLGIAKEFRNRWKDAEEKPADRTEDELVGSRYEKVLRDVRLEDMLCTILRAIDTAKAVAENDVNRFADSLERERGHSHGQTDVAAAEAFMAMELDEANFVRNAPWEAMPDAMDWD